MAAVYPQRMSAGLRSTVIVAFGSLWLTGCYWLVLHYFFAKPSDFGPIENPWSVTILRIHGWIAVSGVFLLGWITARHVSDRWPQMIKRVSGIAMASVAVLLGLTGYALYYTTDRVHDAAGVAHEVIGVAAFLFALTHWRRHRPTRRQRLAS
ncbi:MAG: hypothetical protein QOI59_588 [Gammaproteobacteria bacterium]|nr:hypothetical protein [Gammaproteobacteria bacterium]